MNVTMTTSVYRCQQSWNEEVEVRRRRHRRVELVGGGEQNLQKINGAIRPRTAGLLSSAILSLHRVRTSAQRRYDVAWAACPARLQRAMPHRERRRATRGADALRISAGKGRVWW